MERMTMEPIDITGLDLADVLIALYDRARVQGLGVLHASVRPLERVEAQQLIRADLYFDYLRGRVMKIKIENPLNPRLYDRDNGKGACADVIANLRALQGR